MYKIIFEEVSSFCLFINLNIINENSVKNLNKKRPSESRTCTQSIPYHRTKIKV